MPDRFHWVVPGKLAGMSLPGRMTPLRDDLQKIAQRGIRAVVSATEGVLDVNELQRLGLEYLHVPIDDFGIPTLGQVETFCGWVDERMKAGDAVAVHCFAGLGRTGTLIACWIVQDSAREPEEVLRTIRRIEPGFVQTEQQERFISQWATHKRRKTKS